MSNVVLLNAVNLPGNAFVASQPVMLERDWLTIDFTIVVATGVTQVQFFPEFTGENPNAVATAWFRQVVSDDGAGGLVNMAKTVNVFQENNGNNLAVGTHLLSVQLLVRHMFARIQAGIVSGGGTAVMSAVARFGSQPITP